MISITFFFVKQFWLKNSLTFFLIGYENANYLKTPNANHLKTGISFLKKNDSKKSGYGF